MATKNIYLYEQNLLKNYSYLTSQNKQIKVCPVLKSNAYGHGLKEIGKILDKVNAPLFFVNSLDEAKTLFDSGIKTPIHIMGYVDPIDIEKEKLPFSYTLYNYAQLSSIRRPTQIHIFVDTGMHREGFRLEKLPQLLSTLKEYKNINVSGIMSHFASADKPNSHQTKTQLKQFKVAVDLVKKSNFNPKYIHIAASAGFLNFAQDRYIGNIARVGKALYGVDPRGKNMNLKPVLKLTTKIIQIKNLDPNKKIGYNGTYKTKHNTVLGILPVGYFDGLDRRLSNKGHVLVKNTACPIVGRISMNITTIDITNVKDAKVNDEVTVLSNKSADPNSIQSIARRTKTIPYDIAVKINPFIERICVPQPL
jgi:alanine racemase